MKQILLGWRFFSFQKINYKRLDFTLYRGKRTNFPPSPPPWLRTHFDNFWGSAFSRTIWIKGALFWGKIKRPFPLCFYFAPFFLPRALFFTHPFSAFFFWAALAFPNGYFWLLFLFVLGPSLRVIWSSSFFFRPFLSERAILFFSALGNLYCVVCIVCVCNFSFFYV